MFLGNRLPFRSWPWAVCSRTRRQLLSNVKHSASMWFKACKLSSAVQVLCIFVANWLDLRCSVSTAIVFCFFRLSLFRLSLSVLILFINFFSVQNVVSRFAIAAMVAKICATGTIILFGAYFLLIKGNFKLGYTLNWVVNFHLIIYGFKKR